MMRHLVVLLILPAAIFADPLPGEPATKPPFEIGKPLPCPKRWVWEQSKLNFPETPGTVYDVSYYSKSEEEDFNKALENGTTSMGFLAKIMEKGASSPTTVTIAADRPALLRILWRLDTTDLKVKSLPYLNVHIISQPGIEPQIENIFARYEAHVAFTALALPNCDAQPQ